MTFEELNEKLVKGEIYPIWSKKDNGDGFPGEPNTACPVFFGRCRLLEDGRLECSMRQNTEEELPQGHWFFIDNDKDLEPWIIKVGKEELK